MTSSTLCSGELEDDVAEFLDWSDEDHAPELCAGLTQLYEQGQLFDIALRVRAAAARSSLLVLGLEEAVNVLAFCNLS